MRRQLNWWQRARFWIELNHRRMDWAKLAGRLLLILLAAGGFFLPGLLVFDMDLLFPNQQMAAAAGRSETRWAPSGRWRPSSRSGKGRL